MRELINHVDKAQRAPGSKKGGEGQNPGAYVCLLYFPRVTPLERMGGKTRV